MSRLVNEEKYINTQEAIELLGISKPSFYSNVKGRLRPRQFDGKKANWWRERDVMDVKEGKTTRKASIGISGVFENWSLHLQSLGYHVETQDRFAPEVTTLPEEVNELFHLSIPTDRRFVKRSKMTFANGTPICVWSTFYPLELVEDLLPGMKEGTVHSIPEIIKANHGLIAGYGKDKETARITSLDELNLFQLLTDEAVILLRRIACTEDKKTLLWYSDMVLLSSWFSPEHEYQIHHWAA